MSTVRCLAILNNRRKVINVGGAFRESDVLQALMESDLQQFIPVSARIQLYDKDFEEFVDMDSESVVQEHSKLNVIVENDLGDALNMETPPPATGIRETARLLQKEKHNYCLPEMPYHISRQLAQISESAEVSSDLRRAIIRWLHADLLSYGPYPGNLYADAGRRLVIKHPVLSDKTGSSFVRLFYSFQIYAKYKCRLFFFLIPDVRFSSAEGLGSWQIALKFRTKNERRKITDVEEVNDARKKARRSAGGCPIVASKAATKRGEIPVNDTEDEHSIQALKEFMKKETKKCVEDQNIPRLQDAMRRTFAERRRWMAQSNATVLEVIAEYPALATLEAVHEEFTRITKQNGEENLLSFINKHGERLLERARKLKSAAAIIKAHDEASSRAMSEEEKKYCFASAVLQLMPCFVKENPKRFFSQEENCKFPSVVAAGDPFQLFPQVAAVEGLKVDTVDFISALACVFELYWAFNIHYDAQLRQTFAVFEFAFCVEASFAPGVLATRMVTSMK
ncbi:uncharacterized protein LOC144112525 [Amblyomma americanum]